MARKTRKAPRHTTARKRQSAMTIPEIRRSFEHVEGMVNDMLLHSSGVTRAEKVSRLQKEWRAVFRRELDKSMAESFLDHRAEVTGSKSSRGKTQRQRKTSHRAMHHHGGMAPLDYAIRPGTYLAPGQPPAANGSLPLSNGAASAYGSFTDYITSGFRIPAESHRSDPVPGQSSFPPQMKGGARSRVPRRVQQVHSAPSEKRQEGGSTIGSWISQAFMRPIGPPDSGVPTPLHDAQRMIQGGTVGPSSDQVQRSPTYSCMF